MSRMLIALAVVAAVLLPGVPAWAHAQLVASDPATGATLTTAPASVALTFSERLNADFTTIVVSDSAQQRIAAAAPAIDGGKGTVALTQPLGNGVHTVAYRVVSVDGHTVQGSYTFTVADPELPAAPRAAVSSAPAVAAGAGESGGLPAPALIGLGAFGAACILAAGLLYLSRRRRAAAAGLPQA